MRTSPAPGFGISRSTISKSPPGLEICATFIGAIATLVVAINPPMIFSCWSQIQLLRTFTHHLPWTPGESFQERREHRAEGLRPHTLSGWDSCENVLQQ